MVMGVTLSVAMKILQVVEMEHRKVMKNVMMEILKIEMDVPLLAKNVPQKRIYDQAFYDSR